jgi:signal transduction histidine kinase
VPGQRTALEPVLASLLRAMDKLHADLHMDLGADEVPPDLAFAGEQQDLQEVLGNLLDNACRNARGAATVKARREGSWLRVTVDDDGPGIAAEQRAAVLQAVCAWTSAATAADSVWLTWWTSRGCTTATLN